MWYRVFKHLLIGPILWTFCRPRVVGRGQIPAQGPVIIAANHTSFIDSLLLCLIIRRRLSFVAKSDYFDRRDRRGRLQRWFFTAVGQIPIDRAGGHRSADALDRAAGILADGGIWAIHPEGTRCRDGRVHRGHTGVMRVAAATHTPVIPIGLRGTARVNPPGRRMWRPHRVDIVVGRPLAPPAPVTDDGDSHELRLATDRLMAEIAVLAGQPYADTYATRAGRNRRAVPAPGQ